ncbi:hypothetical protein CTI14_71410, partial [Methylobacterium radiotolerans]
PAGPVISAEQARATICGSIGVLAEGHGAVERRFADRTPPAGPVISAEQARATICGSIGVLAEGHGAVERR